MNHGLGLEDEPAIGNELLSLDAKLSFLATKRVVRSSAQPIVEPTDGLDDGAAQRHIAAHQVAHRRGGVRLPPIAASDDPIELGGPPLRSRSLPYRLGGTADSENMWIGIVGEQLADPIGFANRIVIEKQNDLTCRGCYAGVSRSGKTRRAAAGDDLSQRHCLFRSMSQLIVVVDDDQQLVDRRGLLPD